MYVKIVTVWSILMVNLSSIIKIIIVVDMNSEEEDSISQFRKIYENNIITEWS